MAPSVLLVKLYPQILGYIVFLLGSRIAEWRMKLIVIVGTAAECCELKRYKLGHWGELAGVDQP